MTAFDLGVFAAKLIFGTLAFLLIGYLGSSSDRRVAGVMLTFPVLNGIGPLTSPDKDPVAVAAAMMPMIALNALLFFCFITAFLSARSAARGASRRMLAYGIGVAGALIWFLVAWQVMPALEPVVPSPGVSTVLNAAAVAVITPLIWSVPAIAQSGAAPPNRQPFAAFWWQRRWRVAFFVASLFVLLAAAAFSSAEWLGRLSALPLVPLCVLAGLAIDDPDSLPPIRDPIFIGPALAMVFVWAYTIALVPVQALGGTAYWLLGIITLAAGWAACFLVIRWSTPRLAAALDRWRSR
jgi:hypothetical protein